MTVSVLSEAEELIFGERAKQYGPPIISFDRIARLWSVYLGLTVTAQDVSMMMILLKVSRSKEAIDRDGAPQRDSIVDIAGYAGCSERLQEG